MGETYVWELRNPDGGALGLEFARGASAPTDTMLVHAAPSRINVEVRTWEGELVAVGRNLMHGEVAPMTKLTISGHKVNRVNLWPRGGDIAPAVRQARAT